MNTIMNQVLQENSIGTWKLVDDQLYGDDCFLNLIGASKELDAQECLKFHLSHVHPEDQEQFGEYVRKLSEERTEIVYRFLHPEKGIMMIRCSGKKMEDGSIAGIHQDISDIVRLEKDKIIETYLSETNEKLRNQNVAQNDYYKEILDELPCGVFAYTVKEHRIVHLNKRALKIFHIDDLEDVQSKMRSIFKKFEYPDPTTNDRLIALRTHDGSVDFEVIINPKESYEVHALAKSKVFKNPNGERIIITIFVDISNLVMLKQSLEQAKEGSAAKSAFLFNMSHDLRTPLNAIIGFSELMKSHWEDSKVSRNYLEKIDESSQYLLSLINNILEMSKIESGKEELKEKPWDIYTSCDNLLQFFEPDIRQKNQTLNYAVNIKHNMILTDSLKIREIYVNLMSNAIKYTNVGGTISFSLEEIEREEGLSDYKAVVQDTGIGISKEYLPHIFENFTREKTSSESGVIGTGLGMPIVKKLVDLMHGTISIESEEGKGTTVVVNLPHRYIVEEQEVKEVDDKEIDLTGKHILLVEDNDLNAEIAQTLLEDKGLKVMRAKDGLEAITMVKENAVDCFDCILMDIQMPRMNGFEACKVIRSLPNNRSQLPIIALTANAFEEDRKDCLDAGMSDHVSKPIEIQSLLQTIESVLKK
ncbi:response regulator [uncultured Holdemanella sp.]|uniref:response regulator n=1 Tax=uncultured Holdemanella sp. TaxID=1763549 RepID=UPI0025CCAD29|nr:response regulator [uncultured Holdemanella sp.]